MPLIWLLNGILCGALFGNPSPGSGSAGVTYGNPLPFCLADAELLRRKRGRGAPRKLNNVFCIPFGNLRSRSFASVIGIKRGAVDQFPYPRFQARHLQPAAVGLQVHRW